MAAAEARTAWQRVANRCLVQEDAKRAPKLACCPSSVAQQQDTSNGNTGNVQDPPVLGFVPSSWNCMNSSNLPPDTIWWLLQPNLKYPKDLVYEQPYCDFDDKKLENDDLKESPLCKLEVCEDASDMAAAVWDVKDKQPQNLLSGMEPHWADDRNKQPWWKTADEDELAQLVAEKALQPVENCDLPRPVQVAHIHEEVVGKVESFSHSTSSKLSDGGRSPGERNIFHSSHSESKSDVGKEPSRAQLLEALRHAQTRAREAEMAARKALDEMDQMVKLLFKQASHLFACKQWLVMLQLENLKSQLNFKDRQIGTLFANFPQIQLVRKFSEERSQAMSSGKGNNMNKKKLSKYVIVIAVGLGLAGAGLLLGWTIGLLLPKP